MSGPLDAAARAVLCAAALSACGPGRAQAPATQPPPDPPPEVTDEAPKAAPPASDAPRRRLDRVEIRSRQDEVDQRRVSTASKIVVGREEIEQYGDDTLGEVLKRLPGVTIGGRTRRGGDIRLRGMGSYTQILVDGERVPRGFSIDQISPEQIERIEIYRAPTAETGARAIAGTINIVLREPLRASSDDLRLALVAEGSRASPNATWTRNDVLGERGTYNLTLSAHRADHLTDTLTRTTHTDLASGGIDLLQERSSLQHSVRDSLQVSSRINWQLGAGEQFGLQPFAVVTQGRSETAGALRQLAGATPAPYATSEAGGSGGTRLGRLAFHWRKPLPQGTRLEVRGNAGAYESDLDSAIDEYSPAGAAVLDQRTRTKLRDLSWGTTMKLSHLVAERHSLVAGLEASGAHRDERASTLVNGVAALPDFDGTLNASVRRLAAYLQDEWDPSPAWSVSAGARWEGILTTSESIGAPARNRSSVLTPLLHAVWRFDAPKRDQLRLSLTRSYRAPTLQNLTALPSLSTLHPVPGANTASSFDRAGNPGLRPEIARGFDIAYEHYLPTSGVLSASVFRRDIRDLVRNITALENTPWASVPRWVSRPQNVGSAVAQGVELDGKFRLDDLVAGAPAVQVRTSLSVYSSRVGGVPGPDNRIDGQPRASGNLGADYRLRSLPLTVGGNLHVVPPHAVRQTQDQAQAFGLKRVVDAFALLTIDPRTKVRLGVGNLVPRDYVTTTTVRAAGQSQATESRGPSQRAVSLRLEMKL